MKQKEIWLANLNPTEGFEIYGHRPVVILSGETMNLHSQLRIVCPITSKIKHRESCVFLQKDDLNKLEMDSEVLPFQVRAVDKNRLIHKIGDLSDAQFTAVKNGLFDVLTY